MTLARSFLVADQGTQRVEALLVGDIGVIGFYTRMFADLISVKPTAQNGANL
jgi:hypothetical protein